VSAIIVPLSGNQDTENKGISWQATERRWVLSAYGHLCSTSEQVDSLGAEAKREGEGGVKKKHEATRPKSL